MQSQLGHKPVESGSPKSFYDLLVVKGKKQNGQAIPSVPFRPYTDFMNVKL
ncbi:MAG TPA: hypothetical protein VF220_06095 [Nitrososphaeraceae archaeon]